MTQHSPKRYHPLQVTLHWLTVVLVFAAFILGKYSSFLPNDASEIADVSSSGADTANNCRSVGLPTTSSPIVAPHTHLWPTRDIGKRAETI